MRVNFNLLFIIAITASVLDAKTLMVGEGRVYSKVSAAIQAAVPLTEDLLIYVELPTGSTSAPDVVDAAAIGGFNGFSVRVEGVMSLPRLTAYIEDESVLEWDGEDFQEDYVNVKGLEGVEGRTDFQNAYYYAKDHLGSTRMAINVATIETKEANAYYSYGNFNKIVASADPVKEKFTGKELDEEMGLVFFGARYYDYKLGVWISPDPLREYPSAYSYVGGNPLTLKDPDGKGAIGATFTGVTTFGLTFYGLRQNNIPNDVAFAASVGAGSIAAAADAIADPLDLAGTIMVGGISSGISDAMIQQITTGKVDAGKSMEAAMGGMAGGLFSKLAITKFFAKESRNPYGLTTTSLTPKLYSNAEKGIVASEKTKAAVNGSLGSILGDWATKAFGGNFDKK